MFEKKLYILTATLEKKSVENKRSCKDAFSLRNMSQFLEKSVLTQKVFVIHFKNSEVPTEKKTVYIRNKTKFLQ